MKSNPPPRRLSVDKGSKFHDAFACLWVEVKLDGEVQSMVKEYDLDKQWILRYKKDEAGKFIRGGFGQNFVVERKHGKVEVSWQQ